MSTRTGGALDAWLRETAGWAERGLEASLAGRDVPERLSLAMRHALLGGGKRLRPAVVRAVADLAGGTDAAALAPACAIELVHTYSLVHDDLPCMDDDDLRRGRPTVHVAFDEATAVLVGDALQALAFEVLAESGAPGTGELVRVLASAAGAVGMVGGQALDLSLESSGAGAVDRAAIADVHRRKTAALFAAAAELGAVAAGADAGTRGRARTWGEALGLAFQAVDDLLDVTGDAGTLGKTPGKDERLERPTLVAALGLEGARAEARRLTGRAREAAADLGAAADHPVRGLVEFVLARSA